MATGSIVGYAYAMEFFIAWYSGNPYERYAFINRAIGHYAWAYWTMISCNVFFPQLFWFKKVRSNMLVVFILSILVNIGMWFERFVIVVISLHRDFIPSNWGYFRSDLGGHSHLSGHVRPVLYLLPAVPAFSADHCHLRKSKGVTPQADPHHPLGGAKTGGHH